MKFTKEISLISAVCSKERAKKFYLPFQKEWRALVSFTQRLEKAV